MDISNNREEIWKDIDGYQGIYQVSNLGRVRSYDRTRYNGRTNNCKVKGRILKPYKMPVKCGYYMQVTLCANDVQKKYCVHRLVAEAFVENPQQKPCVNHKDGDKSNNCVDNLEWSTFSENNQHAYDMKLKQARELTSDQAKKMRSKVDISHLYRQVKDMTTGKIYESIKSTKEDGFYPKNVQRVCSGNAKTHHGHVFAYVQKEVI